ncbi:MAG: phosphotransferase [Gammaproteobacteria bacterium]|nr:phosphotransferase [Gammaproteobacteria bacterium]
MNDRSSQRKQFLIQHNWGEATISALIPDASTRRYFRLTKGTDHAMLMDDIGGAANVKPFVQVTKHLASLDVRTPKIYHQDGENGFLMLEDLGNDTFTTLLNKGCDDYELYPRAIDLLAKLHNQPNAKKIELPPYDFKHFIDEANLFADWYVPATKKMKLEPSQRSLYRTTWQQIFQALPPLQSTLVLRDYHVDNLMLIHDQCAALDYQDALIGSIAYDVVSLLEDARRDVSMTLSAEMKQRYLEQNPETNRAHFDHHLTVWGVQRHCKVAGIFVRLWLRDNKPVYLRHLHRVMSLIERHIDNPNLFPLKNWMEENKVSLKHSALDPNQADLARAVINSPF